MPTPNLIWIKNENEHFQKRMILLFLPHDWVCYDFDYTCVNPFDRDERQRKKKADWKREEDKHVRDEKQKVESSLDTK